MLDICLLGTGGMLPLPNRWLTSLMTRFQGSNLLIDCGEGTQIAIKEKGWSFKSIDTICFTHYHADHISGLPGLLLSMGNSGRTEPVLLIGPIGLIETVTALRTIAPELPFCIEYLELTQPQQTIARFGYHLSAFRVNHNIVCYGYTIEIPRAGKFQIEKALKLNLPKQYWGRLQRGETIEIDGNNITPDAVLGESRKGIKLTYCTDTRPVPAIIEAAKSSDLLICEGMYGELDQQEKANKYKHMTFHEAAHLAKQAEVTKMWLTHYSPSLTNPEKFIDDIRDIFPNVEAGEDGKSTLLTFEE